MKFEVLTGEDAEKAWFAKEELEVLLSDVTWSARKDPNLPTDNVSMYRIKPKPPANKRVPLGPVDVQPGSVLKYASWISGAWTSILCVDCVGVIIPGIAVEKEILFPQVKTWKDLMDYKISRDFGKTWEPCWKEEEE